MAQTIADLFYDTLKFDLPDAFAAKAGGAYRPISHRELQVRVERLALALHARGLRSGDRLAILSENRPEWAMADFACALLGVVSVPIYHTLTADQTAYILQDAGARWLLVSNPAQLAKVRPALDRLPDLETLLILDGNGEEPTECAGKTRVTWSRLQEEGEAQDGRRGEVRAWAGERRPEDLLTLIYTSGTTGHPKGVQLTHHAAMFTARKVREIIAFPPGSRVISWLPSAHIAERMAHHYIPIVYAGTVTCAPDPREVVSYLPQVRPNWFFAVPRIWEKLKAGLEAMLAAQPEEQRAPVAQALAAATERVRLTQRGEPVPAALEAAVAAADEQIFSKLRVMLGLDQLVAVNVGAAPTPVPVLEFFHAIGVEVAELWGMSETCGTGAVNRVGQVRIGTVGPATPGVELSLAPDGELLCRGEFLMSGYRNQPELTAEAIDADGWLHTGDIATIDADGYVTIVDRKKEIIINAAGKNMSPANIEAAVKSGSPLIGQACCIGDGRPYNTALIVLDADFAPQWAAREGLGERRLEELAQEPAMVAAIQVGIDEANRHLARVEQIKTFRIVPGDWVAGGEELTPTMKLRRKPIAHKYAEAIEQLYGGG